MQKFKRQFDPNWKGVPNKKVYEEPSLTEPDQSIPLRVLLSNHVRGIPSQVKVLDGQYYDTEIPVIEDLNDVTDERERLKEEAAELEKTAKAEKAAIAKKREEKAVEKAKAAILDANSDSVSGSANKRPKKDGNVTE